MKPFTEYNSRLPYHCCTRKWYGNAC